MATQIPTTGIEYTIVPDGNLPDDTYTGPTYPGSDIPYTFVSTDISYNSCVPINGYRINMRYRLVSENPIPPTGTPGDPGYDPGGIEYVIGYPSWEIVSQTLVCTSHPDNPFQQDNPLFVTPPGDASAATAGIVDGSCYGYFDVFDESSSGYLEPQGPYDSTPIEDEVVPSEPYDPDNDIYPIDALTEFVPDTRPSVTVTFELYTKFKIFGSDVEQEETATIFHTVTQNTDDWSAQVKSLVERSYFYHGFTPLMPDPR